MPKLIAKITAKTVGFAAFIVWAYIVSHLLTSGGHWILWAAMLPVNFIVGWVIGGSTTDDVLMLRFAIAWRRASRNGRPIWLCDGGDHDA